MPYVVPVGGIIEVTVEGRANNQVTLSVLHYRLIAAAGVPDGDAAAQALLNELNNPLDLIGAYAACCSNHFELVAISAQWIHPTRFHRNDQNSLIPNGQRAGDMLPPNVSAAITKLADEATRHGRGTLHMPGVPAPEVLDGLVQANQLIRYDTLGVQIKKVRQAGTMVPILFNRLAPTQSVVITATRSEETSRVNRRRTVGVGI